MKPLPLLMSLAALTIGPTTGPALELRLPLERTAYQANEIIDLHVLRQATNALPSGTLELALLSHEGGRLEFQFPVQAVPATSGSARAVEFLRVNGWLLRPGPYQVDVSCDGQQARTNLEVFPHLRRSTFKLINWGRAKGVEQLPQGEANLGFNLFYGNYSADAEANCIRAGVDFMACCVMSGGHQMDLRQECDWSDPYVLRGGTRRVVRRAFIDRTRGNVYGVHFYDEPGLTWHKHPDTGEWTPHGLPAQVQSFAAAFGQAPPAYHEVNPADPASVARWQHWATWKLGFMDAAWKDAAFGIARVRPDYVSVTQSQYGYGAFVDGYYFNVVRSLPVISGHGGYHDFGPGYFNPSLFLEMARARDYARPNWYLPTWYSSTTTDEFRVEQYLSFQCNLQGMISPPDLEPATSSKAMQGIVEANHLMGRLRTIFSTLPVTRPPVAMLFSLSHMIQAQALDRAKNYAHETAHGRNLPLAYLAGKWLQHQFGVVLDEDVVDGTLANEHQAVLLVSLDHLDAPIIAGLEQFAKNGGLVLRTSDCTVQVPGAIDLGVKPGLEHAARIRELKQAGQNKEAEALSTLQHQLAAAARFAEALRPHLLKAGITAPVQSSEPGLVVTRQAKGDLEYLFVVNATHDPAAHPTLGLNPVTATLTFPNDGRPLYDAVRGGISTELAQPEAGPSRARFAFGPGQMRVFARSRRAIGSVGCGTPVVHRDFTATSAPLEVRFSAGVLDVSGQILSGSIPLRITLTAPLGHVRYDLYRATDGGTLNLSLPLGVNDPRGTWQVRVIELLNRTEGTNQFELPRISTAAAAAGAIPRALVLAQDQEPIYRLFREHQTFAIVPGTNAYNRRAAERLSEILAPWNVRCTVVDLAVAAKPRALTQVESRTWVGLDFGRVNPERLSPAMSGFDISGPVLLLGTPEDNPLIRFLVDQRFLPYRPEPQVLPGPGRGYVAWQREAIGVNQESITLIAQDATGMEEAVGTLYELMAGIQPLTPLRLPVISRVEPIDRGAGVAQLKVAWTRLLPDRITALQVDAGKVKALTHARVAAELAAESGTAQMRELSAEEYERAVSEFQRTIPAEAKAAAQRQAGPGRLVKFALEKDGATAVVFWGGEMCLWDKEGKSLACWRSPQDLTAIAWLGSQLIAGDADGRLTALRR